MHISKAGLYKRDRTLDRLRLVERDRSTRLHRPLTERERRRDPASLIPKQFSASRHRVEVRLVAVRLGQQLLPSQGAKVGARVAELWVPVLRAGVSEMLRAVERHARGSMSHRQRLNARRGEQPARASCHRDGGRERQIRAERRMSSCERCERFATTHNLVLAALVDQQEADKGDLDDGASQVDTVTRVEARSIFLHLGSAGAQRR